jgi:hypothetical protein
MSLDFNKIYKDYSNAELLKILKRPTEYQPAAITAATQILEKRHVTSDDHQIVDDYFNDIDNNKKVRKEKTEDLRDKTLDLLEPVLKPSPEIEANKWVNILLLLLAIQYLWTIVVAVIQVVNYTQCYDCSMDISFWAKASAIVYVPFIFFLLLKRRRWGWILLFADNLFSVIARLSQAYIFFKYQSVHQGDTASFLLPLFIRSAFLYFLWREPIAEHFRIDEKTKMKTAKITTIITLLYIIAVIVIV